MSLRQPPLAHVWSRRAYKLGEHATPEWAVACAAAALAAFLLSSALLMTDALYWPGAESVRVAASMFIGPLGLLLAVAVLWHQSGRMSAPAAAFTALAGIPACALAALTAGSWSAGFEAADAGTDPGWFGASTLFFFAAAWTAGTAALVPAVDDLRQLQGFPFLRGVLRVLLAALAAFVLGLVFLVAFPLAPLAATALLFVSLRAAKENQPAADRRRPEVSFPDGAPSALRQQRLVHVAAPPTLPRTAVAVTAAGTLVLGLMCAGFALAGSDWSNLAEDSTAAMNLGLAAGALNAVPLTVAAGIVLQPRLGGVIRWTVLLVCGGLLAEAAAQFAGVGHPWQWPLTLTGGILLGFGFAVPLARFVPGSPPLRFSVTAGAGLALAFVGVIVVSGAGFIAPAASAALLVWCFRPPARQRAVVQPA
ncbi:hypothetical protein ACIQXM_16420 [Arthrobacter sp. NPDC097144]|uniref:hypothetical protein n=1 Tax=Arthrobacter sp. NPDC097144 TaxID=3363946 RepID=UPI0037F5ED6B